MRKVFLDDLPRRGNSNQIDWKRCIGLFIPFIYQKDDIIIESEFKIINYKTENKRSLLNVKYNNNEIYMNISNIKNCNLGELLFENKSYKYNIGDIIKTKNGIIKIIKQVKIKSRNYEKGYEYLCMLDGNINIIYETALNSGQGCNVCHGLKVLIGINDFWTTHKHLAELMKFPERGYKLTHGNDINLEVFVCPFCKYEKSMRLNTITKQGFRCPQCGDKISYGNKFVRSFFNQLNENYIPEYSPDWAIIKHDNPKINGKKKYDIYLPNRNEVWEVHGLQHYEKTNWEKLGGKNLKEEQENDKIKKELAKQNGLKYIVVDARYSNMIHISNNIISLFEIQRYNLNNIDWNKCNQDSLNSLIKIASDLWNNGNNIKQISKLIKVSDCTTRTYLKKASEIKWCSYNAKEEMKNVGKINGVKNIISVIQLSRDNFFIKEWYSIADAGRNLNIYNGHITNCCKGKRKTTGGFKWMYKSDYEKYIKDNNKNKYA